MRILSLLRPWHRLVIVLCALLLFCLGPFALAQKKQSAAKTRQKRASVRHQLAKHQKPAAPRE